MEPHDAARGVTEGDNIVTYWHWSAEIQWVLDPDEFFSFSFLTEIYWKMCNDFRETELKIS